MINKINGADDTHFLKLSKKVIKLIELFYVMIGNFGNIY